MGDLKIPLYYRVQPFRGVFDKEYKLSTRINISFSLMILYNCFTALAAFQ